MLKEIFQKQKLALDHFFSHINYKEMEIFFHEIKRCQEGGRGVLFFTGVGKSGYIAQKIAATMMSTGTKSFYLQPIDALHGDIGMISQNDAVVILSKTGETEELLHLLPQVRNKGAKIFAVVSEKNCRLAKGADFVIELPCQNELCPFDLAPTISSEVQLLFGDVLSIALMQDKGFTLREYSENHPGGKIGKRSSIQVRDLMLDQGKAPLCLPHETLEKVLVDFTDKRCGCLVVIDENRRLKGIFTDGDLRRALQAKGNKVLKETLGSLMSKTPRAIKSDSLAWEALKMMESDQKHPITVLPVVEEEDQVVGLIKMHDIIQAGL